MNSWLLFIDVIFLETLFQNFGFFGQKRPIHSFRLEFFSRLLTCLFGNSKYSQNSVKSLKIQRFESDWNLASPFLEQSNTVLKGASQEKEWHSYLALMNQKRMVGSQFDWFMHQVEHSVSECILIKSPDQSQRLLQGERGPQRGPENHEWKSPHGGPQ